MNAYLYTNGSNEATAQNQNEMKKQESIISKAYRMEAKAKEYTRKGIKLLKEKNEEWKTAHRIAFRFQMAFETLYKKAYEL